MTKIKQAMVLLNDMNTIKKEIDGYVQDLKNILSDWYWMKYPSHEKRYCEGKLICLEDQLTDLESRYYDLDNSDEPDHPVWENDPLAGYVSWEKRL